MLTPAKELLLCYPIINHLSNSTSTASKSCRCHRRRFTVCYLAEQRSMDTHSAPTTTANQVLMRFGGGGFRSTNSQTASNTAAIEFVSKENFSSTNYGSGIDFFTTPLGSTTLTKVFFLGADGNAYLEADNRKIIFGASDDASIYYDGTDLIIDPAEVGSGDLSVGSGGIKVGGLTLIGYTSSTAAPTTTELPTDKDLAIHKDTNTGNVYLAFNDGGSIVSTLLS